jgi:hypothetical protein
MKISWISFKALENKSTIFINLNLIGAATNLEMKQWKLKIQTHQRLPGQDIIEIAQGRGETPKVGGKGRTMRIGAGAEAASSKPETMWTADKGWPNQEIQAGT